jgi:hypothetical protein
LEKGLGPFYSRWPNTALIPGPIPHTKLACVVSFPGHYQAGPRVSWTLHVSLSPSRVETVTHPTQYRICYHSKLVPFLCSSSRCPPVKFRPCPTPRCSVQASVSCPSHPLACRLACMPLASRIATEVLRHPAAPADRGHHRCTTVMSVPSTRRQRLV